MSVCHWCRLEMHIAASCTIDALHRRGRHIAMIPYGEEPDWPVHSERCGDCGTKRGGFHHPGCDIQACPVCFGQMLSCGCRFDEDDSDDLDDGDDFARGQPYGVDGNGLLTEHTTINGVEVVIHYDDDIPPTDITELDGIRVTTALRTVIDIAPDVPFEHLGEIVEDCLGRGLFDVDEAQRRLAEPDMVGRPGAELLRRALAEIG